MLRCRISFCKEEGRCMATARHMEMSLRAAALAPGLVEDVPKTHATREPPGTGVSLFQNPRAKVKKAPAGTGLPIHKMVATVDPLDKPPAPAPPPVPWPWPLALQLPGPAPSQGLLSNTGEVCGPLGGSPRRIGNDWRTATPCNANALSTHCWAGLVATRAECTFVQSLARSRCCVCQCC